MYKIQTNFEKIIVTPLLIYYQKLIYKYKYIYIYINQGAFITLDENLICSFKILKPAIKNKRVLVRSKTPKVLINLSFI